MFSENIKKLRESYDISQSNFAQEIGFSQAAISAWENNTREPGIEALVGIARYFNTSIDYLINGNDTSKSSSPTIETLPQKELSLLINFRKLPPDLQHRASNYMLNLANAIEEEQQLDFTKEKNRRSNTTKKNTF